MGGKCMDQKMNRKTDSKLCLFLDKTVTILVNIYCTPTVCQALFWMLYLCSLIEILHQFEADIIIAQQL